MKRLYYTLQGTQPALAISQDLTQTGINKGQLHFLNKSHSELLSRGVNVATVFEERDIGHSGIYGGILGFVAGLLFNLLLATTSLAEHQGIFVAMCVLCLFTAFGFWCGGMAGISKENHHIEKFHDDLEKGKTLLMVDAYDERQEKSLKDVMSAKHREATYRGQDENYHEFL